LGASWILIGFYRETNSKTLKILLVIISIILLLTLICSLFASISYNSDSFNTGTIVEISYTGSYAGLLDSYSMRIEQADGQMLWYNISIFSSSSFKESISTLKIGDKVRLYESSYFDFIYKYEKIE
jgi:hypothetical protein